MPWNVLIRPGSPGFAPSLRRTRLIQTRRYWRSSRYSGPQTLVRSSVWRTTLPGCVGQVLEQQPFRPRQLDELAVAADHPSLEVDLDVVEREDAGAGLDARGATDDGPNAGRELIRVERLGDVVVGAEVEALGLVGGRALGRQQDDRHRPLLAELAHDLDAVEVRHHDVEQDDVRPNLLGLGEGILAAGRGDDAEALLTEGDRDELRDPRLVIRDEDQWLCSHTTPPMSDSRNGDRSVRVARRDDRMTVRRVQLCSLGVAYGAVDSAGAADWAGGLIVLLLELSTFVVPAPGPRAKYQTATSRMIMPIMPRITPVFEPLPLVDDDGVMVVFVGHWIGLLFGDRDWVHGFRVPPPTWAILSRAPCRAAAADIAEPLRGISIGWSTNPPQRGLRRHRTRWATLAP